MRAIALSILLLAMSIDHKPEPSDSYMKVYTWVLLVDLACILFGV